MKPILFNTEMVRAIRSGVKTVTRRLELKMPYRPGDILYVRETWCEIWGENGTWLNYGYAADGEPDTDYWGIFRNGVPIKSFKWRPSIHMPREAARIFLRVTDVRVERLQGSFFAPISPIFAFQEEGIDIGDDCRECIENYGEPCCVETVDEDGSNLYGDECGLLDEARGTFADLWDSTIKPTDRATYGWEANPWVWVIKFERCEKPEGSD